MLGALSLKWKWKERREAANLPVDKPNLVFGGDVHVVWEKFCRYFDVEPRIIPLAENKYTIGPDDVAPHLDENTIGVVGVLGTTFTGHMDDIVGINQLLLDTEGRPGSRHPDARRRRQRRVRLAVPLPPLEVGLPARAGAVDQRVGPQVRARLPGHRLAGLPREVRPGRGPRLLRELPGQDRRDVHAELLDRRLDGARAVLQLRPARARRLHLRDGADAAERPGPRGRAARQRALRGDRRRARAAAAGGLPAQGRPRHGVRRVGHRLAALGRARLDGAGVHPARRTPRT